MNRILKMSLLLLSTACGLWFAQATAAEPEQAAQDKPITIEADSAELDERKGLSIYTGHVVIRREDIRIEAHRVTLTSGQGGLQSMVAEGSADGPVRLYQQRQGQEDIEGESMRLEYDADSNSLLLLDHAWLRQGLNRFSGKRIEYDIRQEKVIASQGEGGQQRVTVTIQPKSSTSQPAEAKPAEQ